MGLRSDEIFRYRSMYNYCVFDASPFSGFSDSESFSFESLLFEVSCCCCCCSCSSRAARMASSFDSRFVRFASSAAAVCSPLVCRG